MIHLFGKEMNTRKLRTYTDIRNSTVFNNFTIKEIIIVGLLYLHHHKLTPTWIIRENVNGHSLVIGIKTQMANKIRYDIATSMR